MDTHESNARAQDQRLLYLEAYTKVVLRGFSCVSEYLRAKDQDLKLAKQAFVASFVAELRNQCFAEATHVVDGAETLLCENQWTVVLGVFPKGGQWGTIPDAVLRLQASHAGGRISYLLATAGKYLPESRQCFSDRARRDQRERGWQGQGKEKKGAGKGKYKPPQAKCAAAPANPQGWILDPCLSPSVCLFRIRIVAVASWSIFRLLLFAPSFLRPCSPRLASWVAAFLKGRFFLCYLYVLLGFFFLRLIVTSGSTSLRPSFRCSCLLQPRGFLDTPLPWCASHLPTYVLVPRRSRLFKRSLYFLFIVLCEVRLFVIPLFNRFVPCVTFGLIHGCLSWWIWRFLKMHSFGPRSR